MRPFSLLSILLLSASACASPSEDVAPTSHDESEATETTTRPLTIGEWNLEYFGSEALGPKDDAVQVANAATVIGRLAPDVMGVEEIENEARFGELETSLPDYAGLTAVDPRVVGGAAAYAEIPSRLAVLYKRGRATLLGAKVLSGIDDGRPPLEVSFSLDGRSELVLIVVHFYPFAERYSWTRRRASADALKRYLDTNHAGTEVAVVGDWNDDVDTSIVDGEPSPFAQLRDDAQHYAFVTQGLSVAQQGTTTGYSSTIDHHLVTNELAARFVPKSAWVERPPYIADYRATTSDHYPVVTRYALPR